MKGQPKAAAASPFTHAHMQTHFVLPVIQEKDAIFAVILFLQIEPGQIFHAMVHEGGKEGERLITQEMPEHTRIYKSTSRVHEEN